MTSNVLYDLSEVLLKAANEADKAGLDRFFVDLGFGDTASDAKLRILAMFNEALNLVAHLQIPDEKIAERLAKLTKIQKQFLDACNAPNVGDFKKRVAATINGDQLALMGDTAMNVDTTQPLDRMQFLRETESLIVAVEASDASEYLRRSLLIKINSIRRIVLECEHIGDDEIRARIKSIYADCASEFRTLDREHEELLEKVRRWAWGASKVGIFALALAADTSAVAGLLSVDPGVPALPSPKG